MDQEHTLLGDEEQLWEAWESLDPNSFIYQVQNGRKGNNAGINNGLNTVNKYIYGTQKATYYLCGADSGIGKTTLVDYMYVLSTWIFAKKKGVPIRIYYCSFEISKAQKIARWVSFYIYLTTGRSLPSSYILGKITGMKPSDEDMPLIINAHKMVKKMLKDIVIIDVPLSPTNIYETLLTAYYELNGKLERRKISAAAEKKGHKGEIIKYTPNDPNAMCVLVIDHLALLEEEFGLTTKQNIDKMSRLAIKLRNICSTTIVFIQQFSTDLLQHKREQISKLSSNKRAFAILPNRLDFGETKIPYRDADVVFGLVKPFLFDIENFNGLQTTAVAHGGLGGYVIVLCLLKNRNGGDTKMIPLFIDPIAGSIEAIPSPENEDSLIPYYTKAKLLEQTMYKYSPKD